MKPILHPKLVNDRFGDPGLLVQFLHERRALLFDLGDISALSNATLLKVSHVFVSHTHIDHFYGFDHLLRMVFGRGKTLTLYGPEHFIANVEGKLKGFTWNLVDRYSESITIAAVEVHPDHLRKATFRAIDKFARSGETRLPFEDGVLLEEPTFCVRAAILEHRVPCLGFALEEKQHVSVKKDVLEAQDIAKGPWLNEIKRLICEGASDDHIIRVPLSGNGQERFRETTLGRLKEELVTVCAGQKIAYVVDTVFNDTNNRRIVDLVRGADLFFCESPFLAEEVDRARDRCHLTSRQAGLLAREAGVRKLLTFHFSPKHSGEEARLDREAQDAFREGAAAVNDGPR